MSRLNDKINKNINFMIKTLFGTDLPISSIDFYTRYIKFRIKHSMNKPIHDVCFEHDTLFSPINFFMHIIVC